MQDFHRRSNRLAGYDYSEAGAYFVTLVTHERRYLFGQVAGGEMRLSAEGEIVKEEWIKSARIRKEIEIDMDAFVIMPNHIHGIVNIMDISDDEVRAYGHTPLPEPLISHKPPSQAASFRSPSKTLGAMIRGFKSAVTTRINHLRDASGEPIWLRNYYEHIIMSDEEYDAIAAYIEFNPSNWGEKNEYYDADGEYPG